MTMWSIDQAIAYAAGQSAHSTENETNMCCHFVAECYGFGFSGYTSALVHAESLQLQQGPAPRGAACFWGGGDGHEALSDGNGNIYSTDILRTGLVDLVPIGRIAQDWGKPFLGWALPNSTTFTNSGGTNPNPAPVIVPPKPPGASVNLTVKVLGHAVVVPIPVGDDLEIDMTVSTATPPPPPPPPPANHFNPVAINESAVTYGQVDNSVSFHSTILPEVYRVMGITSQAAQNFWTAGLITAAGRESSYDFNAVNTTDSNATGPTVADGHPQNCSRGVLQCIPPTFAEHHQAGTSDDIYDAVANTCAAMNYVVSRYGVSQDGHDLAAKVQQFDPTRSPLGY